MKSKKKKKKQKKNHLRVIFSTTLVLILVVLAVFYYGLSNISVGKGSGNYPIPKDNINILAIGVAKGLSDTIMLCNINTNENSINIFSIPRDTYFPRKGYNNTASKKINASYGNGGADSVVKSVQELTGVPIHYYVEFDYDAVEAIVDAMGGIDVQAPHNMDYDDPTDNLHIHFEKGQVVSKGEDIIKILRWRKNNKGGGYKEGDIGRIQTQQSIVNLGIEKFRKELVFNIFKLQKSIKKHVRANMTPKQMMILGSKVIKINKENIDIKTIPGKSKYISGLSFFVANKEKLDKILTNIKE